VTDLLPLQPIESRELFRQIQFPRLTPLPCEEPLSYNPALFYLTLERITRDSFTTEEKKESKQFSFFEGYESDLQSHSQIGAIVDSLTSLGFSKWQLQEAVAIFSSRLQQLRGDARSFASLATGPRGYGLTSPIAKLIQILESNNLSSADILDSFRSYLLTNLGATVCAEAWGSKDDALPGAVRYFNQELRNRPQGTR
jgi:hypothetical protein